MLNIQFINVGSVPIAYSVFGRGKINLVIEMGLGCCMGEWWHIAERLSSSYTVLLYERAGNGSSHRSKQPRTPYQIATELFELLQLLEHEDKITILAHSQGGLYAQQFVRLFPDFVQALVLLDPLSAHDNQFREKLSKKEYKRSGVNKSGSLYIQLLLAKLRLGSLIKSMMKNAPPFYYFNGFSEEARKYILDCLTKPRFYRTAIDEYKLAHDDGAISELKTQAGFPEIPILLITHTSEIAIQEIIQFGGLNYEQAKKVEVIWQTLMCEYLSLSSTHFHILAHHSSHYIHLTDTEMLCKLLTDKSFLGRVELSHPADSFPCFP